MPWFVPIRSSIEFYFFEYLILVPFIYPFSNDSVEADTPCERYCWTNMLYINNLYPNQFDSDNANLGCMDWCAFNVVLIILYLSYFITQDMVSRSRHAAVASIAISDQASYHQQTSGVDDPASTSCCSCLH